MSDGRYALAHGLNFFDAAVTNGLQQLLPAAVGSVLHVASLLGGTPGWLLLIALSFWWSGSRLGVRVALVISASAILNVLLKWTLRQPRPYFLTTGIAPLEASDGFGMPSGHAQGAATAWGAVARWSRSRVIGWLGLVMTLLAGFARIYFGVHSTLQVVCGWGIGMAAVMLAARLEPRIARWWEQAERRVRWSVVLVVPLALLGGGLLLRAWLEGHWTVPAEWVERHQAVATELGVGGSEELRLFDVSALARWTGSLLGALLAAAWWASPGRAPLEIRTWARRLVHTTIGTAAAAIVLRVGLMVVVALGELVEFVRFAVLLWVLAVAAPWLAEWSCSRLGLDGTSGSKS